MLEKLIILLGFSEDDVTPELEEKLELILESVQARLKNLLGGMEIPDSMEYIVIEVAISRFNRIGSENMSSHSVAGESITYTENDFAPYMDEIQAFLNSQEGHSIGKVRFI